MSGAIAQRANETTKALGGKASYLWATFAVFSRWQNSELRVAVDDEIRGGRMHDVIVANGRYLGGGMRICPDAEPDDGLFDVLLIGDLTKRDLADDAAQDVLRPPSPAPEGRAPPRRRSRSTRRSRCRWSSTASSRARRPSASRSSRSACGSACRPPSRRSRRLSSPAGAGGFFAAVFFAAAGFGVAAVSSLASLRSSLSTRFSSASRPRSFFCMSSSRVAALVDHVHRHGSAARHVRRAC